jgi:hypothetical protein
MADVYWWFRRFVRRFMFQTIHNVALMNYRDVSFEVCRGLRLVTINAWRWPEPHGDFEEQPDGELAFTPDDREAFDRSAEVERHEDSEEVPWRRD